MPLTGGVNIPLCFETYNKLYMSNNTEEAKFLYAVRLSGILTIGEAKFASQCLQCEKFLEKCPKHLDIPIILESVVEELEGPDLEERVELAKQAFNVHKSEKFEMLKRQNEDIV